MIADFRAEKGAGELKHMRMYPRGLPACRGHLSDVLFLKIRAPLVVTRMFNTKHFQFNWRQYIDFSALTFHHDRWFRGQKGAWEQRHMRMYPMSLWACRDHLSDVIILKIRAPPAVTRMFSTNYYLFNSRKYIEFYVVTFYHDCWFLGRKKGWRTETHAQVPQGSAGL